MQSRRWTGAPGWVLAFMVVAAAMLWPAAINGRPSYYFDSEGYYSNGRAAVLSVEKTIRRLVHAPTASHPDAAPSKAAKNVVATRAIAYSVFAYLTSWPHGKMVATIIIHALVLAGVLLIWWRRAAPGIPWQAALAAGLALAAFSSAAWFTSFVMPDIFAGAGLLAFLTMILPSERPLRLRERVFLVLVIAFAFASHISNIPLLAAVSCLGMGVLLFKAWRNASPLDLREIGWLASPIALGIAIVLTSSMIGFSQVSLAPKRLPLVLARSVGDGPARWFLMKHCATEHYTVCQVFPGGVMPKDHAEFLFGPHGLRARATPEQMEAIRREEGEIVKRAAREYPFQQIAIGGRNFFRQVFAWGLWDNEFRREAELRPNGAIRLRDVDEIKGLRPTFNDASTALVIVAAFYLTAMARRLRPGEITVLAVTIAALLVNAAVTGVLSSVANRYGGRVIWLLPAVALAFWLSRRWPGATDEVTSDSPTSVTAPNPHRDQGAEGEAPAASA